jgi:glycosyltransferase involved in cell wall biosynthesis
MRHADIEVQRLLPENLGRDRELVDPLAPSFRAHQRINCSRQGAMPRAPKTLALGYNLNHLGGSLLYSIPRFHTEFVTALLARGEWRRLLLIATPFARRRDRERLDERPTIKAILRGKPSGVSVELTDYATLATSPGRPPAVLHEGSFQDLVRPFRLRRVYESDHFPITVSHHGLTPADTLRIFGLDLLLCDSRPYDALVCTSRSAMSAIQAFMEHTRASLSRHHGASPRFHGRFEQIPLGVDTRAYRPRAKAPLRERLGLPKDAVVLLWFGRFTFAAKADLLPLLRVLRSLHDESPGVNLLLVVAGDKGPDSDEAIFRAYAAELGLSSHVRRLLDVLPEDNPSVFAAADIFVCPSDGVFENFGLAPIQAMACGVPQVASDWDGHRDTIVHGETGFLAPTLWGPCDPEISLRASFLEPGDELPLLSQTTAIDVRALREHLGALIRGRSLRTAMGRRSRERACSLFSLENVADRYASLWRELSAEARASRAPPPRFSDTRLAPLLDMYRDHVTHVLRGGARLRLSEPGERVVAGAEVMPIAGMEPSMVEKPVLLRVLTTLARRGSEGEGDAIVRAVARGCRRSPPAVWCNVMWLIKYGYVEPNGPL